MVTGTSKSRKALRAFSTSRKMPADLRKAITADDVGAFHAAFLEVLARPLKRIRKQLGDRPLLALGSESTIELAGRERELAAALDEMADSSTQRGRRKNKKAREDSPYEEILANWLTESAGVPGPWETIVLAEILLREGHRISAERFVETLTVLAEAMLRESLGGLFEGTESDNSSNDPIRQIILTGESRWLCGLLLSPLQTALPLQKSGSEALEKILKDCTDSDGVIHGSLLKRLPEWLTPLARSVFWAEAFEQPLWTEKSQQRMDALIERTAMLVLPVSEHSSGKDVPEPSAPTLNQVLELLLLNSGTEWRKRIERLLKGCRELPPEDVPRPKKFKKKKTEDDEPAKTDAAESKPAKGAKPPAEKPKLAASWESDPSCLAVLRSSLEADADVATLEWHSSDAQIMLAAAGVPIFSGFWNWSVRIDDEAVPAPSTWKCSCWFLDPETVFVEIEGEDSAAIKRVRQVLLAPHERFAILTDSVTCKDPNRKVQLVTSLPLTEGCVCAIDSVTREVNILAGSRSVRTFPVWMEDDRIQHTLGSYREHDGQLELSGIGRGGVTLPLALDWHPRRADAPADWARLTVTESRRVVHEDEAAGYRVRIGDHQVLIYRSLVAGKNSRAVLGLHTWDESVYTRVPNKPGPLEPLVEVETPE
jgi:hypothetical protein